MVTILALVSAILYGTADFLGGAGSRRVPVLALLMMSAPAGAALMILAALLAGGAPPTAGALAWGAASGIAGGFGLIVFYAGLAAGPMSVVAPVSALVATLLPVGVALQAGERPGLPVLGGAAACLAAIFLVSMDPDGSRGNRGRRHTRRWSLWGSASGSTLPRWRRMLRPTKITAAAPRRSSGEPEARASSSSVTVADPLRRGEPSRRGEPAPPASSSGVAAAQPAPRGLLYGLAAGAAFGLFFVLLRNAAQSGPGWGGLWPLVASRAAGALVVLVVAASTRTTMLQWGSNRGPALMALGSGVFDAAANIFYVLATRHGLFSLAVVITSLYPAMTVLLARVVLGERIRGLQRAGLVLAALGVVLVTV